MRFMLLASLMAISPDLLATEIKIATYNTESDDDTNWPTVAADIGSISGIDIWGLQEVEGQGALDTYLKEIGAGQWDAVLSRSGASNSPTYMSDQLAIMYRTTDSCYKFCDTKCNNRFVTLNAEKCYFAYYFQCVTSVQIWCNKCNICNKIAGFVTRNHRFCYTKARHALSAIACPQ